MLREKIWLVKGEGRKYRGCEKDKRGQEQDPGKGEELYFAIILR